MREYDTPGASEVGECYTIEEIREEQNTNLSEEERSTVHRRA